MPEYKVDVTTGDNALSGTFDHIYITLVGTQGESEKTELDNVGLDFKTGMTGTYFVKTSSSLGKLLLVKLEKEPYYHFPEDEWFCSRIAVTTPEGDDILFPCYRWISRNEPVELRGGKAVKVYEEDHPLLIEHRKNELKFKQDLYEWKVADENLPHHSNFKSVSDLPADNSFSSEKTIEMTYTKGTIGGELIVKGLSGSAEEWQNFDDIKKIFWSKKTQMSEYVAEHWKEDDFYGYQFLNAFNPNEIKKCTELPPNFPVTEEMVKPLLAEGTTLQKEIENGNIFICDYKRMENLPSRSYHGFTLQVIGGLCLFYVDPEKKLRPIAIQLHQTPSDNNPIFLANDLETDWMLAKMFIRNADVLQYQTVYHFLNTRNLAEVFTVATLRNFPVIHPLYKLLIPHGRYTLQINTMVHSSIFGPDGLLCTSSLQLDGLNELMRRAFAETTYTTLCLPDNIAARGLETIPNYYYRDDGLKLWGIINRFVRGMVQYYYPSDSDVQKDTELQSWIKEIFIHAFLGKKFAGYPDAFNTAEELIKFITMVIFTVSGQHAAVNNPQFDHVYAPNMPFLLRKPPPTTKGQTNMKIVMDTLPNVGETVNFTAMGWILSKKYSDKVLLGNYPEIRFDEPIPKHIIRKFQGELSRLSVKIQSRNAQLEVPYRYLDPAQIENSIAI